MKTIFSILTFSLFIVFFVGCDDDENGLGPAPQPPQGVYSVTGDHAVYLYWNGVYDAGITEYIIYRSYYADSNYVEKGRVTAEDNPDMHLYIYEYTDSTAHNGTTYYYAIASVDNDGRVSDLSAETVYDTPRPEGQVVLFPNTVESTLSGFNFETQRQVDYTSDAADIYIDTFQAIYYLNKGNNLTDIMDRGYTTSFDDVSYSTSTNQDSGWAKVSYVELIQGHTYVVWTSDNHFAKMRVLSFNPVTGSVSFQWAWQSAIGNPELAPGMQKRINPGVDTVESVHVSERTF
jgi:hypothetical protein